MIKKSANEWRSKFESYEDSVNELSLQLKYLRYDHDLLQREYTFHFAVDFYDVVKHIFPFYPSIESKSLSDEKEFQQFIRAQIARGFIFHGLTENLILLPPHLIELHNFMEIERRKTTKEAFISLMQGSDKLERMVGNKILKENDVLDQNWDNAIEKIGSGIDEDSLLDLGVEHYKELQAISQLKIASAKGSELLSKLFGKKRFVLAEEFIHDFTIDENMLYENLPDRKKGLSSFQKKSHPAYSALNDAVALEYLFQLNNHTLGHGKKELVIFITSSRPMLNTLGVLGNFGMPDLPEGYNFVRCPDFWLTYLMLRRGEWLDKKTVDGMSSHERKKYLNKFHAQTMEQIENTNRDIDEFRQTVDSFAAVEGTDSIPKGKSDYLEKAGKVLERVKVRLNSWENLKLMSNRGLMHDLVKAVDKFNINVLNEIAAKLKTTDRLDERISERINGILKDINRAMEQTQWLIQAQQLHIGPIKKLFGFVDNEMYLRIKRRGRYETTEYQFHFDNDDLKSVADEVRSLLKGSSSQNLHKILQKINSLAVQKEFQWEIPFFFATIYFLFEQYDEVLDEINHGCEIVNVDGKKPEFCLLATMIHREKNDNEKAEHVCRQGIKDKPEDARLNRELAGILRIKADRSVAKLKPALLKEAEEKYRIAIRKASSVHFELEVMASLALFLVKRGQANDTNLADEMIEEYDKRFEGKGIEEKHARYWLAVSHVNYAKAQSCRDAIKKEFLIKARKAFNEARKVDPSVDQDKIPNKIDGLLEGTV